MYQKKFKINFIKNWNIKVFIDENLILLSFLYNMIIRKVENM